MIKTALFALLSTAAFGIETEIRVPKNERTPIPQIYDGYQIRIADPGKNTFAVHGSTNGTFNKKSGVDPNNRTLIFTARKKSLFYVNTTRARSSECILILVTE